MKIKIIQLRGQGLSLQEIATQLNLSVEQVQAVFVKYSEARFKGEEYLKMWELMGGTPHLNMGRTFSDKLKEKSKKAFTKAVNTPEFKEKIRHNPPRGKYKGVGKQNLDRWDARIRVDGKTKYLGVFKTPEEAAKAYNDAVDLYWGGDGYKNIIDESLIKKSKQAAIE